MIRKTVDIKLNVRPIFIGLQHKYFYEGPCRFGAGDELQPEYDAMMNVEQYAEFQEQMNAHVPEGVNLMPAIYVERDDWFTSKEDVFETMAEDVSNVDLYVFQFLIGRGDLFIEFAQRYNKPVSLVPLACCEDTVNIAALRARGREAYAFLNWQDYERTLCALRARKALRNLNILVASRFSSTKSYSSTDNFVNQEELTDRLGIKFRCISAHELIDQTHMVDCTSNPTLPGRHANNITADDMKEIEKIADELIENASEVRMERAMVIKTIQAYYTVQKLLDYYDCNAFTIPCPDVCSTRRINEEQFTFCMSHSLNNENGIPSSCEMDLNALVSMTMLMNVSGKAPYMGNTNVVYVEDGVMAPVFGNMKQEVIANLEDKSNLYSHFHATPNRKMKGMHGKLGEYALDSFAASGFGATIRYDFNQDIGETITTLRVSPDAKKMLVVKGEVVAAAGADRKSCDEGFFYRVKDNKSLYYNQINFGNHMSMVFGDYTEELKCLGDILGMEVIVE